MESYNDRLKALQTQIGQENRLTNRQQELRKQKQELEKKVFDLEWKRKTEQEDVERLEQGSLANLFYRVTGKMDARLDREKQEALEAAVGSITAQLAPGGLFVASIRDYDALLMEKPPYSPPYIHQTQTGKRVSFQTWVWEGDRYKLTQYIIDDGETLQISKFDCEYRATRRAELTKLLTSSGCSRVEWKFPDETGFYQPVVIAKKD